MVEDDLNDNTNGDVTKLGKRKKVRIGGQMNWKYETFENIAPFKSDKEGSKI